MFERQFIWCASGSVGTLIERGMVKPRHSFAGSAFGRPEEVSTSHCSAAEEPEENGKGIIALWGCSSVG
jgi:hypothetical protein